MHTQQEIQEAAQPISPSLKQPAIQPPEISRYTEKTTESDHKKRKKYAGQATGDWLEAWGKTPGTFPPRNNNYPPGIKIEHI